MKPGSVIVQTKAADQYFPMVLFIFLYNTVTLYSPFESLDDMFIPKKGEYTGVLFSRCCLSRSLQSGCDF